MAFPNHISVVSPLLVGVATTFCTIIVHGLILAMVVTAVRRDLQRGRAGVRFSTDLMIVTAATLLALAGHLVDIGLWALAFDLCGEFSDFASAFYHSAVNYTTLGDSAVVMSAGWRLLGPLAASDGMLMFGVSTAMIFAVVQRLIQTRFGMAES
jgi:ion channel